MKKDHCFPWYYFIFLLYNSIIIRTWFKFLLVFTTSLKTVETFWHLASIPILYPLKTPANQRFSGVFRGYKMRILDKSRLIRSGFVFLSFSREKEEGGIDTYHKWFLEGVTNWLEIAAKKASERTLKALELDEVCDKLTVSSVNFFRCF